MKSGQSAPDDIDQYISAFPKGVQDRLKHRVRNDDWLLFDVKGSPKGVP